MSVSAHWAAGSTWGKVFLFCGDDGMCPIHAALVWIMVIVFNSRIFNESFCNKCDQISVGK